MRPRQLARVLVSLAWPLSNALAVDQALAEPELRGAALFSYEDRGRQSTLESLYPPVKRSDWEADYVRDDMADHGQWEAQMDYDVARKQRRDMQKQAKNSMKAAVIAEEEFEDMQKKELALRDMMLQARSLAKKQDDVITALKAKQNWQKESLKWIEEDIKYGKGEIKKFEKAIKTVGQKIKEKEKRIEAMKHNHSPQKKAAFSAQEVQEMASRLQRLKKILQNRKAALKATRKKFQNLRKQELKAEKKLQQEEKKQDQTGAQSDVLSSIWNRFGWS